MMLLNIIVTFKELGNCCHRHVCSVQTKNSIFSISFLQSNWSLLKYIGLSNFKMFLGHLTKGNVSFCHHLASVVTSFSYSNRDELQIKTVIDHDLKELDEWPKKWLMTFNSDKTEIMLFSNTDIPEFNFTFNERTIPITNSHKHLGVTFSSDAK